MNHEMTDLLTTATNRRARSRAHSQTHSRGPAEAPRRPLAVGAAVAGAAAAGSVLLVCMALGLVGWFASDAGAHGDTRDALRVGADAWLLAHGGRLSISGATISVIPLGLTMFCGYVLFRMGRWAGSTCVAEDSRAVVLGSAVLAGVYGVVATTTAVLSSVEQARPNAGLAFVGGFALALLAGGAGIARASGAWDRWRDRLPEFVVAVGTGALAVVLLMLAAGALVVFGALLLDFGSAENVLARLHIDVPGGLLYTLVVVTVIPNAALFAGAYAAGPGFMVGTGTLVSPAVVALGPVPAFPLLAALPDTGPAPWWTILLAVIPVVVGFVAAAGMLRRYPVPQYELGALRGLVGGTLGGLLFGVLVALAGGSVGPGRMTEVGALVGQTFIAAIVAIGVGGLLGGLATTWWLRRSLRRRRSTAETASD